MTPVLRREKISQWEGWSIVLFLYLIEFFSYLLLSLSEEKISPSLSIELLDLIAQILAYSIILGFCLNRFGGIDLFELVPNRRDAIVLIVALLIEFWVLGLLVGPEGLRTNLYESIRELPTSQYWLGVFIIVGLVPLVEETVFRRYFLAIQQQHYSTGIAVLITAGVATLFHFTGSIFPLLWHFSQQVFLSIVYVKSRLGVSVLVHAFVNALVLFLSR